MNPQIIKQRNEVLINLKSLRRAAVMMLFSIMLVFFFEGVAKAQSSTRLEQQCFNAVQGKVAYDRAGNKTWSPSNIRNLCKGTTSPTRTIACFRTQIRTHNNWSRGIQACKAKPARQIVKPNTARVPTRRVTRAKRINEYSYLATHNATASYAYGYSSQNSQRYDVTTQLNAGVRMLNIDIVYDRPDGRGTSGVYICHCGEAPHSDSSIEKARANRKKMRSRIPLPFWSHGATYTRFYKVLKAIDKWLVANPKEIVFIAFENHSATPAQFDMEVGIARLRTRTYKKPVNGNWGTRAQLIRGNQRLVILSEDGLDLGGTYANPKGFLKWEGWLRPSIYGVKNDYNPNDVSAYQFSNVGAFTSTLTDAITARYYNDYDELKARKAEWVRKGYRFPTFISVNQVQVGDALKFVNELNGTDYQVKGTVPKDAFGNWIVNASADIGTGVVGAAKSVGTFVTGKKVSGRSIKFNNQAGYVAKMTVIYQVYQTIAGIRVPIAKTVSTPAISVGFSRPLVIPTNIVRNFPIMVSIQGFGTLKNNVYSTTVSTSFSGELCYKSWGTLFKPRGGKCN